jgi:hypothetical protein
MIFFILANGQNAEIPGSGLSAERKTIEAKQNRMADRSFQ